MLGVEVGCIIIIINIWSWIRDSNVFEVLDLKEIVTIKRKIIENKPVSGISFRGIHTICSFIIFLIEV